MKKPKIVKPFSFRENSHQQMVNLINHDLPIDIRYNEELVDRVHARYPLMDKTQTSIIIKAIFRSLRDLLILGKVLNFNNLFFDTKLLAFRYRKGSAIFPSLKVKITTPPPLRKNDERFE